MSQSSTITFKNIDGEVKFKNDTKKIIFRNSTQSIIFNVSFPDTTGIPYIIPHLIVK